jgi:hypothetical protein
MALALGFRMATSNRIAALLLVTALAGCSGDDDGVGNPRACGEATCADGQVCCDHCTGACVPENSGAFCPDDENPDRDCAGASDGGAIDSGADDGIEEGIGEPFNDGSRCTCPEGGVCVNQSGGPGEPVGLHCGSWRSQECDDEDPCPCVVGEGECALDPDVLGLCQCDNGTV